MTEKSIEDKLKDKRFEQRYITVPDQSDQMILYGWDAQSRIVEIYGIQVEQGKKLVKPLEGNFDVEELLVAVKKFLHFHGKIYDIIYEF